MNTVCLLPLYLALLPGGTAALAAKNAAPVALKSPPAETVGKGTMDVYALFAGTTTAEDFLDVTAPVAGRVEEVMGQLFQWVNPKTTLAKLASLEMAAIIDASPKTSKETAGRKWKDVFGYYEIKPEQTGLIVSVYARPKKRFSENERMFTVARKITVIGKTLEPLYSRLKPGGKAALESADGTVEAEGTVKWVMPAAKDGTHRVGLEITSTAEGLQPGMFFKGKIHLGASKTAAMAPREAIISKNGKKFMILEVQTGLEDAKKIEITQGAEPGRVFLRPAAAGPSEPAAKE